MLGHVRDLSIPIVTITGVVHLVRGALVDAAVFLAVAAALAVDGTADRGRVPRPAGPTTAGHTPAGPLQAGPLQAGPLQAGPTPAGSTPGGPTAAGPTRAGPTAAGPEQGSEPLLVPPSALAGSALVALLLAAGGRFNLAMTIVVAALGVSWLVTAWPQPARPQVTGPQVTGPQVTGPQPVWPQPTEPARDPPAGHLAAWPWAAAALGWCLVELVSFLHEVGRDTSSVDHPTFSSLIGPVLDNRLVLWLALTGWLAGGYALVRIARRAARG